LPDNKKDKSYFALERNRGRKNLLIIIPVVIAVSAGFTGLFLMFGSSNANQMLLHSHVRLNITSDGQPIAIPAHVGMFQAGKAEDRLLYGNHSLDSYGMEGMSPLHTHDESGTIHVESNAVRNFTLGELLGIWQGLNLDGKNVVVKIDGKSVVGYRNVILQDNETITMDIKS
jgi:hypothetical protein